LSVIQAESTFRNDARSPVGAVGLMQVLPSTAKYIAKKWKIQTYKKARDLNDPFINVTVGVAYMAYLRARFENPMHYIAAYNLGPTTVGRMLDENNFALGKVTKYVTEIHAEANSLRNRSNSLVAQN
jgi:soluble lytic murein transglycosylase